MGSPLRDYPNCVTTPTSFLLVRQMPLFIMKQGTSGVFAEYEDARLADLLPFLYSGQSSDLSC